MVVSKGGLAVRGQLIPEWGSHPLPRSSQQGFTWDLNSNANVRKEIQMVRTKANIDIPNLRGTLALVTGASDGLGLEIARRLALAGAEVIMPVRNPKKGAAAVDRIAAEAPDSVVSTRVLDLASLRSVHELGEVLSREGRPINIWVNNAGVDDSPGPPRVRGRIRASVRDELSWSLRVGGPRPAPSQGRSRAHDDHVQPRLTQREDRFRRPAKQQEVQAVAGVQPVQARADFVRP